MRVIDKESWPRREHFALFMQMEYPQFNLCAEVDVTALCRLRERSGQPFYQLMLYEALRAANGVENFRTRIRGEEIVLHDVIHASFTDLREDGETFKMVWTDYRDDRDAFVGAAVEASRSQREMLVEAHEARDDVLYITCLPWVAFTQLTHPIALGNQASIPRVSWGRYVRREGRAVLPVSVQMHHGLADGLHAARFLEALQRNINRGGPPY